jgi:hypothetical protein
MLFYGDPTRIEDARAKLSGIVGALRDVEAMPAGIARHGALVAAFIEAGELAQGIADAEFARRGWRDGRSPAGDAALALLTRLAVAVRFSWDSGFARLDSPPAQAFDALGAATLPETLRTNRAEGFAFYALYPEAYLAAASAAGLPPGQQVKVIGIRSIGAALGALVAAATGAPPPVTLRPIGHPFRRELSLSEELEAELLADPAATFAVADEGPGLSGSSFGAVADFLEDRGVPPGRVHLFPSHGGEPGPQASPRHRARWARAHRHVVEFDALALGAAQRLSSWAAELVGASDGPMEEISGGGWRRLRYAREADWPPVHAQGERRKFLLRAGGRTWLLKFAGLGREGERKLERARALHAAGFVPAVAGYRHGFLVEEWIGRARAPDRSGGHDRARLADRVGRYLGFRARRFPAGSGQGASLAALRGMARHNTAEAMGEEWARRLEHRTAASKASSAAAAERTTTGCTPGSCWRRRTAAPDSGRVGPTTGARPASGARRAWTCPAAAELELGGRVWTHSAPPSSARPARGGARPRRAARALHTSAFQLGACAMAGAGRRADEATRLGRDARALRRAARHAHRTAKDAEPAPRPARRSLHPPPDAPATRAGQERGSNSTRRSSTSEASSAPVPTTGSRAPTPSASNRSRKAGRWATSRPRTRSARASDRRSLTDAVPVGLVCPSTSRHADRASVRDAICRSHIG